MQKADRKNALFIGVISVGTYVANYYLRNMLGVLNPHLVETGKYEVEFLALLSSVYMILYAAGQLVNGIMGDRISPKKMVFMGNTVAGLSMIIFPFAPYQWLQILCFALLGFALSMVRGPLMKIISENTAPNYARTICVFFSFASFAGPLIASLFALVFSWNWAFVAAGAVAIAFAGATWGVFSGLEKKGVITYRSSKGEGIGAILGIFRIEKFGFYMIVACIVEICAASISFWIPTFLTEELHFSKDLANIIFSAISIARSFMPFAALAIFRAVKEKDIPMMRVCFVISASFFALMCLQAGSWVSVGILLVALLAMSCTSALLWSIYIPGLGKTGKVSSVNGVLDCTGYIAAAGANLVFAQVSRLGWNGVYILWAGLAVVGLVSTLFAGKKESKN